MIHISPVVVTKRPSVQAMASCRTGELPELVMTQFTNACMSHRVDMHLFCVLSAYLVVVSSGNYYGSLNWN